MSFVTLIFLCLLLLGIGIVMVISKLAARGKDETDETIEANGKEKI